MRTENDRILEMILEKIRESSNNTSNVIHKVQDYLNELKKKYELLHKETNTHISKVKEVTQITHKQACYKIESLQKSINNLYALIVFGFIFVGLLILYK